MDGVNVTLGEEAATSENTGTIEIAEAGGIPVALE